MNKRAFIRQHKAGGVPARPHKIEKKILEEMEKKRKRLLVPRNFSVRPVLIHVNGADESVLDAGYFDKIIDFSQLVGYAI